VVSRILRCDFTLACLDTFFAFGAGWCIDCCAVLSNLVSLSRAGAFCADAADKPARSAAAAAVAIQCFMGVLHFIAFMSRRARRGHGGKTNERASGSVRRASIGAAVRLHR
jgi:hypothetical protein